MANTIPLSITPHIPLGLLECHGYAVLGGDALRAFVRILRTCSSVAGLNAMCLRVAYFARRASFYCGNIAHYLAQATD